MDFLRKIKVFGSEQAESVIGVSNLLEGFRGIAEFTLKVSPSMDPKLGGFPNENPCFRW